VVFFSDMTEKSKKSKAAGSAKTAKKDALIEDSPSLLTLACQGIFYVFMFAFFVTYLCFVYAPDRFDEKAENDFLRQAGFVFRAIEKFSPFHEYARGLDEELETKKPKTASKTSSNGERLFTSGELKQYDGSISGQGPFLAILGQVFDVSSKADTYGPDGGYGFFSGRDGSRAFVSGNFNEEGLIDDVTGISYFSFNGKNMEASNYFAGLSHSDYLGLQSWLEFYHKDYKYSESLWK